MANKRLKLSFSIDQILGLEDHASSGTAGSQPQSSPTCTATSSSVSLTEERRDEGECHSEYIHSPGSDGVYEYHEEEFKNRKRKRTRTTFSSAQVYELEKKFQRSQYLSAVDRLNLAAALSMSDVQVKRWFQNRRCKERHRAEDLKKIHRSPALLLYQQPYLGAAADALLLQSQLRTLVQLGSWNPPI